MPTLADFTVGTIAWLVQMYIEEIEGMPGKELGASHLYTLRNWQGWPTGKVMATELGPHHLITHCKARRAGTIGKKAVCAATVRQDLTYLRGPLKYAKFGFGLKGISDQALIDAAPILEKFQLVGKGRPRERRPTENELERLFEYYRTRTKQKIPMLAIVEFSLWSARRIGETCRLKWGDVNGADMTCIVRDMKDPKNKKGNDHEFPLLGRAWDIVMAQPRLTDDPNERIFPYIAKSVSANYARAKKKLGIEDLRLHDNRAECASRALEGTLNGEKYSVAETMVLTGHKTPGVLMRTYARLRARDLHRKPKTQPQQEAEFRAAVKLETELVDLGEKFLEEAQTTTPEQPNA